MTSGKIVPIKEGELTPKQQYHMTTIQLATAEGIEKKYTKGALEHRSNLWEMSTARVVESIIEEALDQNTYAFTLRQQMHALICLLKDGAEDESVCATTARENCRLAYEMLVGKE
jgi:hypothetical protein